MSVPVQGEVPYNFIILNNNKHIYHYIFSLVPSFLFYFLTIVAEDKGNIYVMDGTKGSLVTNSQQNLQAA